MTTNDSRETVELKGCPMCGGPPEYFGIYLARIRCAVKLCVEQARGFDTRKEAATDWNTRAESHQDGADARDAARYRFLRECNLATAKTITLGALFQGDTELDEAIDAAIARASAAQKGEG